MIDELHPIDAEGAVAFNESLRSGVAEASLSRCEVGMLARDCRVNLERNLSMLERLSEYFQSFAVHCYANDCTDGTDAVLESWRPTFDTTFVHERLGLPYLGGTRSSERTEALASHRSRVKGMMGVADYYLIIDPDLLCIDERRLLAGLGDMQWSMCDAMAAQQLCYVPELHPNRLINYDAFAWRPDWTWRTNSQMELSFHHDVRPAGAQQYAVRSAFGGACWYRDEYLAGTYDGKDGCEHVGFHRSMDLDMAVSPNMSVIGFLQ